MQFQHGSSTSFEFDRIQGFLVESKGKASGFGENLVYTSYVGFDLHETVVVIDKQKENVLQFLGISSLTNKELFCNSQVSMHCPLSIVSGTGRSYSFISHSCSPLPQPYFCLMKLSFFLRKNSFSLHHDPSGMLQAIRFAKVMTRMIIMHQLLTLRLRRMVARFSTYYPYTPVSTCFHLTPLHDDSRIRAS